MRGIKPNSAPKPLILYSPQNADLGKDYQAFKGNQTQKLASKAKHAGLAFVLIVLVTTGCTTKTVTIKPECEIPELAPMPVIMSDDMECLADDVYWALMDRERLLADWALKMEATLEVVCNK